MKQMVSWGPNSLNMHFLESQCIWTSINHFFLSQFSYCALVWMCRIRELNNRINRLHERSLCVVYHDNIRYFEELLFRDKSFTIHDRNIQNQAIELCKVKKGISPEFMTGIFTPKENRMYYSK